MNDMHDEDTTCQPPAATSDQTVARITLEPEPPPAGYREAMALANREAERQLGQHMLLSWYDRDRDFESPQHASECHSDSATPGYVDYALHRGANLRIDFQRGRFVFYYLALEP
ncbi:MAG: AF1514 family protein [Sedimenticola sp.]|nr:AF1514 family protein [Sedimenticola sp.]